MSASRNRQDGKSIFKNIRWVIRLFITGTNSVLKRSSNLQHALVASQHIGSTSSLSARERLENCHILSFVSVGVITEDFSSCGDRLSDARADMYQIFADALTGEATS